MAAVLPLVACLDGRGTIVIEGGGAGPGPVGPGMDVGEDPDDDMGGGDVDADADTDVDSDGDVDADADSDTDSNSSGEIDSDTGPEIVPETDEDEQPVACTYPDGPYGSDVSGTLPDFPQPLPRCGDGELTTLETYCEAPAIVIHFNSPT